MRHRITPPRPTCARSVTSRAVPARTAAQARRIVLLSAAIVAAAWCATAAQADELVIELRSPGNYRAVQLPRNVADVDLVDAFNGACRMERTWGYNRGTGMLWVDRGCAGRFRVVTYPEAPQPVAPPPVVVAPPPQVVVAPPQHEAATPPRQIQGINGLCLDVAGGAKRGAGTILYPCNRGDNQRFSYTSAGELRVDGYCLDVQGASYDDGARAIAWRCNGEMNQRWRVQGAYIRSELNGKCLTAQDGRGAAGTPVIVASCAGRANQRWRW